MATLRHDPETGEPWLSEETMNELETTVYRWWEIESLIEAAEANDVDLGPKITAEFAELRDAYNEWSHRKK